MSGKKIVLIGAGSAQFGLEAIADIINSKVLSGSILTLHDINKEKLQLVEKVAKTVIQEKKFDFKIESTINRIEALKHADFIIHSIEIGDRFELWEQDYNIPLKYGNRQLFGENGGPGGFFHSARIIPVILEICKDIMQICPSAWFINYSNPMSRICLAIHRKFPGLKMVGLCHEIKTLEGLLPRILNTPLSNLDFKAGGLNHFGILLEIHYKDSGKDAYPDIRKNIDRYFANGRELSLIKDIFDKFHYLPYTTDSHFGEYIHWAYERANLKDVRDFYEGYKISCKKSSESLEKVASGKRSPKSLLKSAGERAIPIIEGIVTDSNHHENSVNIPNDNLITNLPQDLVVEVPATINSKGIHGIKLGDFPKGITALLRNQASVQDVTVEAILKESRDLALQALLVDPVVNSFESAEKILNEMINLQGKYLRLQ